jgi:hypothetical protein
LVESNTNPVRSNTPLATICVSYSIHSSTVGDVEFDIASLSVAAVELFLFQIFKLSTVNALAGQE